MKASTRRKLYTIIVIVAVALAGLYFAKHQAEKAALPNPNVPAITGNTADLISFSIAPGADVEGTVTATGSLKGAYFFEARAQGMILDASKNIVARFPIDATSSWLTSDGVAFTAVIDASQAVPGPGYIRLQNDNPSGDPIRDKYVDIPVVFH